MESVSEVGLWSWVDQPNKALIAQGFESPLSPPFCLIIWRSTQEAEEDGLLNR